jgi:hypothetical protein
VVTFNEDVRQETTPKAGWLPMYGLAAFAYIGAIISFSVIFNSESHKSTTETLIGPADITGKDGYTCQMISKVTTSYELQSSTGDDPAQAFQLVNVIESKSQYEADYATADPCSQPLVYFPGETIDLFPGRYIQYTAAAFYGPDMAYIVTTGLESGIMYMNYTIGRFDAAPLPGYMLTSSIAIDAKGYAMTLGNYGDGTYGVYRVEVNITTNKYVNLINVTDVIAPLILNDNLYNIYLAEHDTFTALDVYSSPASNTTLFTTRDGEFIRYAAVYNSGSSVKIYYVNNTDGANVWEDGVFIDYGYVQDCAGIAVDGEDNLYYLQMGEG